MTDGRVARVNGPLVEVEGLDRVAMADVVLVGTGRVPAEVVSVRAGLVTAQAYEYTGGVRVGDPVVGLGRPLSARLGPGLLGGVFDGLLRPLTGRSAWLTPGSLDVAAEDVRWHFVPSLRAGDAATPGTVAGVVPTAGGTEHRVLVPVGVWGTAEWVAAEGEVGEEEPVAVVAGREISVTELCSVRVARPSAARLDTAAPLLTGQRVVDLLFPVAKGGTVAVPGGFGTGKTVLLQQLLKWCDADVIVFVGCGERGNELADALADLEQISDPSTGRSLLERTVTIGNTSNMPVMAREASIYTGLTVAELYRDMGYDTVLLADSTSRWAEALREFSSRSGELPAEEGYPAGLASALAAFYERAGRFRTLGGEHGTVTVIGAVSPPGGDMTEPVTAHTERFVRCLWSLDRDLAYARHYPAITWARSFSRDVEPVGAWHASAGRPGWVRDRARAVALLAEADRLSSVVELVGLGALPARERMVLLAGRLLREAVLQQSALSDRDAYCAPAKQAALLEMVLAVHDRCLAQVDGGLPASVVEELDLSGVTRVRDEVGPADAQGVSRRRDEILEMLDGLGGPA
ncbi:MAG TPA: V-type ATP synthase subunit A [Candidatus Dormibacteraeota bacterium]|nr:V-type ATP synthase subunit A [Candidatus Dormibacteraeota bacterium]